MFENGSRAYALGIGGEFQRVSLSPVIILSQAGDRYLVAVSLMSERGAIKRKFVRESQLRAFPLNGDPRGPLTESAWKALEDWAANPKNRY